MDKKIGYTVMFALLILGVIINLKVLLTGSIIENKIENHPCLKTKTTVVEKNSRYGYYQYYCPLDRSFRSITGAREVDVGDVFPILIDKTDLDNVKILNEDPVIEENENVGYVNGVVKKIWRLGDPRIWFLFKVDSIEYLKCQFFKTSESIKGINVGDSLTIKYVINLPTRCKIIEFIKNR